MEVTQSNKLHSFSVTRHAKFIRHRLLASVFLLTAVEVTNAPVSSIIFQTLLSLQNFFHAF